MEANKEQEDNLPKIDPEKLFNEEEYSTAFVKKEEEEGKKTSAKKQEIDLPELIKLLGSYDHEHKDAGLEIVKEEMGVKALLEAISQTTDKAQKAVLIAAVWESGLDMKGFEKFFALLAADKDMFVSMEAVTVLESMEIADVKVMQEVLQDIQKIPADHPNEAFIADIKLSLEEKINDSSAQS